jgi:hypothetical protein
VATTPESAHAPELAAFWGHPQSIPAATPEHQSAALGKAHVSRPGGRAGWWKSPCPAPVGARGGQLPPATRSPRDPLAANRGPALRAARNFPTDSS